MRFTHSPAKIPSRRASARRKSAEINHIIIGPMTSPDRKRLYPSTVGHAAGCRTSVEAYVGILEVYPGRFGTHPVGRSYQARTVLFDSTNHLRLSVASRSSGPCPAIDRKIMYPSTNGNSLGGPGFFRSRTLVHPRKHLVVQNSY